MAGKLDVALVATRWQWEALGLGYGPWPPDGAGIQQMTLGFSGSLYKEPQKGSWRWLVHPPSHR